MNRKYKFRPVQRERISVLCPGTGFPDEIGGGINGSAAGTSLNIPYYPYTLDDVWHDAFDAVIPDALAKFQPDAIVFQFGADAHWQDPLAHLLITDEGWMRMADKLFRLTNGLPAIVTGGGGYNQPSSSSGRYGQPYMPNEDSPDYDRRYDPRPYDPRPYNSEEPGKGYSSNEILAAGHSFFGSISKGMANVFEYAFQQQGRPNGLSCSRKAAINNK